MTLDPSCGSSRLGEQTFSRRNVGNLRGFTRGIAPGPGSEPGMPSLDPVAEVVGLANKQFPAVALGDDAGFHPVPHKGHWPLTHLRM